MVRAVGRGSRGCREGRWGCLPLHIGPSRWVEIPLWIFHRALCPADTRLSDPSHVDVAALYALRGILDHVRQQLRSEAEFSGVFRFSRDASGRGTDGTHNRTQPKEGGEPPPRSRTSARSLRHKPSHAGREGTDLVANLGLARAPSRRPSAPRVPRTNARQASDRAARFSGRPPQRIGMA